MVACDHSLQLQLQLTYRHNLLYMRCLHATIHAVVQRHTLPLLLHPHPRRRELQPAVAASTQSHKATSKGPPQLITTSRINPAPFNIQHFPPSTRNPHTKVKTKKPPKFQSPNMIPHRRYDTRGTFPAPYHGSITLMSCQNRTPTADNNDNHPHGKKAEEDPRDRNDRSTIDVDVRHCTTQRRRVRQMVRRSR